MLTTMRRDVSGPRPVDLHRDIRAVTDLIALSFGDRLDAAGQMALEQMRRHSRRREWTQWITSLEFDRPGVLRSGFVWEEAGLVVGNVSLRPARERGGYIIGNVCVHPDWRGRGIASALMENALREMGRYGGRWAGLEVSTGNTAARNLYAGLGFREAGRTLRLIRPVGSPSRVPRVPTPGIAWRRAIHRDGPILFELAETSIPDALHPLLELRRNDYEPGWDRRMDRWLSGMDECWWVATSDGKVRGAVRAVRNRPRAPDRLEVLARAGCDETLGTALGAKGLLSLRRRRSKVVEAILADRWEQLAVALEALGFCRSHELAQMRLNLPSVPIPRQVQSQCSSSQYGDVV